MVLSAIQGLTEFIPVSSSGHLNLFQFIFGLSPSLGLNIFLNTATLMSVLIYFRKSLKYFFDNILFIFIGSLPALFVGIFLRDLVSEIYFHQQLLSLFFLVTSFLVVCTKYLKPKDVKLDYKKAIIIGLFQALAILPGISRSGSTIFAALLLGMSRGNAFNFSFSLFIPASVGAALVDYEGLSQLDLFDPVNVLSFIVAAVIGLIALRFLRNTLTNNNFWLFGIYTLILALLLLFI